MRHHEIKANRVYPIFRQLKDTLLAIEDRAAFFSGNWGNGKDTYAKFMREWPVVEVSFQRPRVSGFFAKILELASREFVFELEDQAFLVNVFGLFRPVSSLAFWSVGNADAADFKAALLARGLGRDNPPHFFGEDLVPFSENLLYLHFLDEMSYEQPSLWLRCGRNVPGEIKRIISDNNLEPYIEGASND